MLMALTAAMQHDESESLSGDIAATFKMGDRVVADAIDDYEREHELGVKIDGCNGGVRNVVKAADMLEALIFCKQERVMGNDTLADVCDQLYKRLDKVWDQLMRADMVNNDVGLWTVYEEAINISSVCIHPGMEGP
jgi:hypothetical protein